MTAAHQRGILSNLYPNIQRNMNCNNLIEIQTRNEWGTLPIDELASTHDGSGSQGQSQPILPGPTPLTRFQLTNLLISNVCSLASKIDELSAVVSINQVDMVCITETWLSTTIPNTAISLSNFNLFRNDRFVSSGGGICAYISSRIYCKRLRNFENPSIAGADLE